MLVHEIRLWFFGHTDSGNRSDKVYWVQIVRRNDGMYEVVAHWGRRGGKLQTQNKGLHGSHWSAVHLFNSLVAQKMEKGYEQTGHKVGRFEYGDAVV